MSEVITNNLELWSSAIRNKSTVGRGSSGKQEAYGISKLRALILELAVRGKLVEQDPNDVPASELLKNIAAKKEKLTKEGKIKKKKPQAAIAKGDELFDIPQGWIWVRFGDIAEHNAGKTLDRGRNTGELKDYITTSNLYWGRFDLTDVRQMLIREDELEKCTARNGDLLICEGGEAGRAAVWDKGYEVCFQNHVHRARFYGDVDPFYAYRYFEQLSVTGELDNYRKGVGISNMSGKSLASIPLPLPPKNMQHRIVDKVDELMSLCDQLEQQQTDSIGAHQTLVETLLSTLTNVDSVVEISEAWSRIAEHFDTLFTTEHSIEQLKQAIFQLAVMGKLVHQDPKDEPANTLLKEIVKEKEKLIENGVIKNRKVSVHKIEDEIIKEVPPNWEYSTVGDLAILVTDGTHKTPNYLDSGIRFVSAKDIATGTLSFDNCKYISEEEHRELTKRCKPEFGDLLVSKSGSIGTVVLVDDANDFSLFESLALIKVSKTYIDKEYFQIALQNACNLMTDSHIRGVAVKHLHLNVLRGIKIPLPPKREQERIVAKFKELLVLCDSVMTGITDLNKTQVHLADSIVKQAVA